MKTADHYFYAIRKTEGNEWIDVNTWGYVPQTCQDKANACDDKIPQWAQNNPVIRISRFIMTEINPI